MAKLWSGEQDVRKWLRERVRWNGGHLTWLEPGQGASAGVPDALLVRRARVVLVELKFLRAITAVGLKACLRPAQISWHSAFSGSGGRSVLVVGDAEQQIWLVKGDRIAALVAGKVELSQLLMGPVGSLEEVWDE